MSLAGWSRPILRCGALGTVGGRPHLFLSDSICHSSAALHQRSAVRLDGCGLAVARQAGDRAQAPVPAGPFGAAFGLSRFERNFDRALARSIPELALAMKPGAPGAGWYSGSAEPGPARLGAQSGVVVLLLSGLAAAGFTAWQYTYGVGVQAKVPRADGGLVSRDDLRWRHHYPCQRPLCAYSGATDQCGRAEPAGNMLRVDYLQGEPFDKRETFLTREQFVKSGLGTPYLQLARGKPGRAQGTLGHYIVFAEMLMQFGCLAWAMLLSAQPHRWGFRRSSPSCSWR